MIYVTSCSSSLSGEENHPEEQWLSLRQQLTWIYEAVADIINLFSFPKAGSEALLWEQTFCTLKQNKSCFLGESARWSQKLGVVLLQLREANLPACGTRSAEDALGFISPGRYHTLS